MNVHKVLRLFAWLPLVAIPLLAMPVAGSEAKLLTYVQGAEPAPLAGEVTWTTEVNTRGELTLRGLAKIDGTLRAILRVEAGLPGVQPFGRTIRISVREWNGGALTQEVRFADLFMGLGDEPPTSIHGARKRISNTEFLFNFLPLSNVGYLRFSNWLSVSMTTADGKRSILSMEIDDTARASFVALGL